MAVEDSGLAEVESNYKSLPRAKAAKCLGEACANFSGVECSTSRLVLVRADGIPVTGTTPPARVEVGHALYIQFCLNDGGPTALRTETEIFREGPDMRDIVGQSPTLPITIVDHNLPPHTEPANLPPA
ncbi:MAG TPA: hypothetical protein VJC09_01695 [Candidatus Saccharimonadales bacterium]|nr:hypothetical protein [Candidatus Saccharimonadales bacterium]